MGRKWLLLGLGLVKQQNSADTVSMGPVLNEVYECNLSHSKNVNTIYGGV